MFTRVLVVFYLTSDTIKVQMFSLYNPGNTALRVGYPQQKTQLPQIFVPREEFHQVIKLRYFSENFVFKRAVLSDRYKT